MVVLPAGVWRSAVAARAQLAALGERVIFERPDSVYERGSPGLLAWRQRARLRPPRELAVGGELQRENLLTREVLRRRAVHDDASSRRCAAAHLRRLQAPDHALAAAVRVVDDDLDWLERLGHATRGRTTTAHEHEELGAQRAVQALAKARDDVAALARRETEPSVVVTDRIPTTGTDRFRSRSCRAGCTSARRR